ncbi:bifunctional metallophosphatase/5'-nucleotidase [Roseateles koreensis]|uniref:Bifunctional metallophosphatase/5'-nucleotidase n=1 Tax=Roseateles koreensis TaxID=2987526 RepID=A0ABT5KSD5_9BURK|nr:bifunctional metallophosphatase/5'-nucleotidase [Roseateles koreensis]MDC8785852.1 bifunctional metallophosphatase/5'-nucleotidase [Roseateles koreensis]
MQTNFRPLPLLKTLTLALAATFGATAAHAMAQAPINVKIIGFNDYHGTLESPGTFGINTSVPSASRPAVGGAEYLAAYVAQMRAGNPNTVVVGAGDFIGASPLISALFYDEPAVETLNKIGVDFTSVGNHEFDKGKDELRRLQSGGCKLVGGVPDANSCRGFGSSAPGTFDGAKFKWLSANVIENATGRPLMAPYGVKSFGGVKVAFIGMTLKGTPGIVTPTGVAGLTFQDEADTVNALVPKLRAQGIESIVVLVHQGGFQNAPVAGGFNNSDINGCLNNLNNSDGSISDIGAIVSRLDNAVDLVISAHTHAAYNCSKNTNDNGSSARTAGLPNKAGRLVPVTSASAFGRVLTEVDIQIDPISRDIIDVSPVNRLVDRTNATVTAAIAANPEVKNVVAAYKTAASPLANQVIGVITAGMSNAANAAGEMEAGDLIADAQLQATQPAPLGGAVMAFMNAGGVRSPGFVKSASGSYPYSLSYGEAFTVQPFGNSLVTMTLTAQQLKDVLEQQFAGCKGQTTQRIMQISNGLRYSWKASGAACAKITDVAFTPTDVTVYPPQITGPVDNVVIGGVVQNPSKTYRVTVNNYMANGGDGFATLLGGSNTQGGAQDIDALVAYLSGYKTTAAPYIPSSPVFSKPRITQLP